MRCWFLCPGLAAYTTHAGWISRGARFGENPPVRSSDILTDDRNHPFLPNFKSFSTCNIEPRCAVAPFGETVGDNVGASTLGAAVATISSASRRRRLRLPGPLPLEPICGAGDQSVLRSSGAPWPPDRGQHRLQSTVRRELEAPGTARCGDGRSRHDAEREPRWAEAGKTVGLSI